MTFFASSISLFITAFLASVSKAHNLSSNIDSRTHDYLLIQYNPSYEAASGVLNDHEESNTEDAYCIVVGSSPNSPKQVRLKIPT